MDDADDLQRLRGMLLQADKLAELGRQTAGLVHEMNQPLLGIKAFAQMLKGDLSGDERAQRKAIFIEEQAVILERLLDRVRRFSRHEEVDESGAACMREAAMTALAVLGHRMRKAGVTPVLDIAENLPSARIGEVHAQQLLVNLLSNAADAVEGRTERRIAVRADRDGDHVVLVVGDSGEGVPEDVRDRLFEPFFTTKTTERGTGLGLPICLEIVTAYGGQIALKCDHDAESAAGPGMRTAFEVKLPLAS